MNPILRALLGPNRGLRYRWHMAMASYAYSRGHGLTRLESLWGAIEMMR